MLRVQPSAAAIYVPHWFWRGSYSAPPMLLNLRGLTFAHWLHIIVPIQREDGQLALSSPENTHSALAGWHTKLSAPSHRALGVQDLRVDQPVAIHGCFAHATAKFAGW